MAWKVCLLQFRCKSRFFLELVAGKLSVDPMNYEPPSCKGLNTRIPIVIPFEERVFSSVVYSR